MKRPRFVPKRTKFVESADYARSQRFPARILYCDLTLKPTYGTCNAESECSDRSDELGAIRTVSVGSGKPLRRPRIYGGYGQCDKTSNTGSQYRADGW
jgi:hypothetical protein